MSGRGIRLSSLFDGNPGSLAEVHRRIDFAARSYPRGVGTSASSSPPEAKGGTNSGTFMAYADGPEIVSGDGRVPKIKLKAKPALPKRK
jgi:hypothetical protein